MDFSLMFGKTFVNAYFCTKERTRLVMERKRLKYPIGVQDFEDLRRNGYVYVDKTRKIYEIATKGKCYFLGRPRRFGKSLLLSTFEAYFLGKKALFQGLAIENLENEWAEYPVLHLDLNLGKYDNEAALDEVLNKMLNAWEKIYSKSDDEITPGMRFYGVIQRAFEQTGKQVVILVDEYDKPLLNTFDNPELQDKYRSLLKSFYSVLKTQDRYIRFALLTGVTKFGKVSVFSDLNNLDDISMDERYADICGITEHELHIYFDDAIEQLAEKNGISFDEACGQLRNQYDGYHFCVDCAGTYNPFSLLNALNKGRIADYWFETGTPTFLVQLLKDCDYNLNKLQNGEAEAAELSGVNAFAGNPIPMIYQSGYLTIKGYDKRFEQYLLGFPNKEVENGFVRQLLPMYANNRKSNTSFEVKRFIADVESGDPESFMTRLQTFFEDADYRISGKKEIYFQNVMFIVFKIMGFYTEVERATSRGRIDVVIKTRDYIYIIECKLDGSADDALNQIEERGYWKPYVLDPRKIFKIGVNFSSEIRGIKDWKVK